MASSTQERVEEVMDGLNAETRRTIELLKDEILRCEKDVDKSVAHAHYLQGLIDKLENGEEI